MQQLVVSYLLEAGGRDVGRWLGGLAVLGVMLLLLVVSAPVIVVAALAGPAIPTGAAAAHQATPAAVAVQPASGPASSAAVDVARRYLGVPYVFGGSNPAIGLDCSGLVQLVFRQLGVALPRTAQTQFAATARVTQEQLQPGDLVFFSRTYIDPHDWITHVGIYVGNGLQINAPTEGQVVSIQPVFSGFWGAHFAGGGRVGRA
ncbi:MAG TPA: NlpC/P60 family protein [Chloroflexota bacterium]